MNITQYLFVLLWGCASTPSSSEEAQVEPEIRIPTQVSPPPMQLELPDLSGVRNGRWMSRRLAVGGVVDEEAFEVLAQDGLKIVVDLRRSQEMLKAEQPLAEEAGLIYVHMPVGGLEDMTADWLLEFGRIVGGDESTLIHCASGNRVGAAFALHAHHHRGATFEEAVLIGRRHGLTGLEAALRDLWGDSLE